MELKDYLLMELGGLERNIKRVTDTLTDAEIAWRPACGCNSIGLILYHVARSQDGFVNRTFKNAPEVWETGEWWKKLNMPKDEAGAHYTAEQVNAFPVPKLQPLLDYWAAVQKMTVEYAGTLKADDFDKKYELGGPFGAMPAAAIWSLIVSHAAGHVGEISYLRGLQRGQEPMGPPPKE